MIAWLSNHDASIWKAVSAGAGLVATTILPVLKWSKLLPTVAAEKAQWVVMKNEYEDLLHDIDAGGSDAVAKKEFERVRKKDVAAEKAESVLPRYKGLIQQSRKEVCIYRGLEA